MCEISPATPSVNPDETITYSLTLQCTDATLLLEDADIKENRGADESSVPRLAAAIISQILQGHCFRRRNLPSPFFFTDYIFTSLNRTSNLQITGKSNWFDMHNKNRHLIFALFFCHYADYSVTNAKLISFIFSKADTRAASYVSPLFKA